MKPYGIIGMGFVDFKVEARLTLLMWKWLALAAHLLLGAEGRYESANQVARWIAACWWYRDRERCWIS